MEKFTQTSSMSTIATKTKRFADYVYIGAHSITNQLDRMLKEKRFTQVELFWLQRLLWQYISEGVCMCMVDHMKGDPVFLSKMALVGHVNVIKALSAEPKAVPKQVYERLRPEIQQLVLEGEEDESEVIEHVIWCWDNASDGNVDMREENEEVDLMQHLKHLDRMLEELMENDD